MTLFTDTEAELQPRRRRLKAGWVSVLLAVTVAVIVSLVPSPYVIEQPGPVFNTLGSAPSGTQQVPLITIPTQKTYPTTGALDMLTVSVLGTPQGLPNWVEVAAAWLDPTKAVLPVAALYPSGVTTNLVNQQNSIEMKNSQQDAIAAALTELGYTFTSTLTVAGFSPHSPAAGVLKTGDEIISVNGQTLRDVSSLRQAIKKNGVSAPAAVTIRRAGVDSVVRVTPVLSGTGAAAVPILGVLVGSDYSFPFEVKIQLANVGGPSAGMMFALGIIDKLTPGSLTGGKKVAGTGTITATGSVGPIGGIRQKLYGARDAGASYFLAPAANCSEVVGHVPSGLTVFSVRTLKDSLAALKGIAAGSTRGLVTCG